MNRREAFNSLTTLSGEKVSLPDWAFGWEPENIALRSTTFSSNERQLISSVINTLIPENGTVGALSVGVDKFLVRLFEECYETDVQENIKKQLASLQHQAIKDMGNDFADCNQQERERLLLLYKESDDKAQQQFFNLIKTETNRGFRTSRVVMENQLDYEIMPGHYNGYAEVSTAN